MTKKGKGINPSFYNKVIDLVDSENQIVVEFCGVVVITCALHAYGRGFNPHQN